MNAPCVTFVLLHAGTYVITGLNLSPGYLFPIFSGPRTCRFLGNKTSGCISVSTNDGRYAAPPSSFQKKKKIAPHLEILRLREHRRGANRMLVGNLNAHETVRVCSATIGSIKLTRLREELTMPMMRSDFTAALNEPRLAGHAIHLL